MLLWYVLKEEAGHAVQLVYSVSHVWHLYSHAIQVEVGEYHTDVLWHVHNPVAASIVVFSDTIQVTHAVPVVHVKQED